MKRITVFLITFIFIITFAACGAEDVNEIQEEIPVTTEQQIIDDAIEDYSILKVSELEMLAYEGDSTAQYYLGLAYEYGTDEVNQDFSKSLEWYSQAAVMDNADAYAAIGYFYLNGFSVEKDVDKAIEYFDYAMELGSVNAKVGKARAVIYKYTEDDLLTIQLAMAEDEEEEKAELESSAAEYEQPVSEEEAAEEDEESIDEQAQVEAAVELIREASVAGDVDAGYYLGVCFQNGIGVNPDPSRAIGCYQRVVASQSERLIDQYAINSANVALGLMYFSGLGVEQDYAHALSYFEIASDDGFAKGQYYCGQVYENGIGVETDYKKALEYYLMAADDDFAPALNQIGYLYYNGYGVDVDFSSAVYYQKLAALQGYAPAQVNLGYLYENGYGIERNLETALSYYELAEKAGYEGATEAALRVRAQISEEEQL